MSSTLPQDCLASASRMPQKNLPRISASIPDRQHNQIFTHFMQSHPGTGSGSAFAFCGNICGIFASGSCGIALKSRVTQSTSVLREYLRYLRIWQLRYHPERPGDPIHPRFAEAMKALPTVNHFLDCLLGNDLLLAEKTAELLCEEGYIQRLSDYVSSIHGPERRECA